MEEFIVLATSNKTVKVNDGLSEDTCQSGGMVYTAALKVAEVNPHEGSNPSSGTNLKYRSLSLH